MQRACFGLALLMLIQGPAQAADDDAMAMARRFGALEDARHAALSPDGARIVYVAQGDNASVAYVADLTKGDAPIGLLSIPATDGNIYACRWVTVLRLVCNVRSVQRDEAGRLLTFTRAFAINADRTGLVKLSAPSNSSMQYSMQFGGGIIDLRGGQPGEVLMTRQHVPTTRIGTISGTDKEGLGVDVVDTVTLKRTILEQPRKSATEYISDGQGTVRITGSVVVNDEGYMTGGRRYSYRLANSREWQPLSRVEMSDVGLSTGFDPYAVDKAKNIVYGFDKQDGFDALFSVSLDGSLTRSLVLARPDTDVDSLIKIGPYGRVVGASYATDRRTAEYFDPELSRLRSALGKVLPGQPLIDIVDATQDESKLLLLASGDTDPGMIYLYDKNSHKLASLLPIRSALAGIQLAPVKAITFKAADGTSIPAYLTLPAGSSGKGLPAIVMPHGGPQARDEWGFDWLAQFYAARGYAVIQPNYRGSAGYGVAWFQKNGWRSWRTAIGDVNDAGRWLVAEGIASPGKLAIVGWSYGGYAALQGAAIDPQLYSAVVAVAPVTDLARLKQESAFFANGRIMERFIGTGPHVHDGSPTENVASIVAPVLMFHGDMDQNVDVGESRLMERKLKAAGKPVTYVEFPGLDHFLNSATARTRLLSESDAFLRKAMNLTK